MKRMRRPLLSLAIAAVLVFQLFAPVSVLAVEEIEAVVGCEAIVIGNAANVPVTVTGTVSASAKAELLGKEIGFVNGRAIFKLSAEDTKNLTPGIVTISVIDGGEVVATAPLEVVTQPSGLWSMTYSYIPGNLLINFAAEVTGANLNVNISGEDVPFKLNGSTLEVSLTLPVGASAVKVSGVKFAKYFPSYSFSFNSSYTYVPVNTNPTSAGNLSMFEAGEMTVGSKRNIQLEYNVTSKVSPISGSNPQYPKWEVRFFLPAEFPATTDDEVSIVGQDNRKLTVSEISMGGRLVTLSGLELQPKNGGDVRLYLFGRTIPSVGEFEFMATNAIAGKNHSVGAASEKTVLKGVTPVSDFKRVIPIERFSVPDYSKVQFSWIAPANASSVALEMSTDNGATWQNVAYTAQTKTVTYDDVYKVESINGELVTRRQAAEVVPLDEIVVGLREFPKYAVGVSVTTADVTGLALDTDYIFRLNVTGGKNAGISNTAKYHSGFFNILDFGAKSSATTGSATNNTAAIQAAYDAAAATGGGTVYVPAGIYGQGTVHLRSNVYLYLEKDAMIWGLPYCDDRGERLNEYQDGGHSYHHDAMYYGVRLDNIKFIGLGKIDGGTATQTGDPSVGSGKADKQISIMLCTNFEFGGYGAPEGTYALSDKSNKLLADRVGHFQLLSDACKYMDIHDFYVEDTTTNYRIGEFGIRQYHTNNAYRNRDILDLMGDSYVNIENIYCEFAADDIVKLGCDYSAGFTVKSGHYRVNNIEAWTWCNGFQCGSETVGDLSNVHVSNLTIWQADKAGFSLCINDGMTIRNVLLDGTNFFTQCRVPVHLVTSNRGRRPGGAALNQVGSIHDVTITNLTIRDNTGIRSTGTYPITVSGYYNSRDGATTYNSNITFKNIDFVTLRNPGATINSTPVEVPENDYQVSAMGNRPSFGFYIRHTKGVTIQDCKVSYKDGQDGGLYAVATSDVDGVVIDNLTAKQSVSNDYIMKTINSSNVTFRNSVLPFVNGFTRTPR